MGSAPRKPELTIYWQTLERLGTVGDQCFFIDDMAENVDAVRKVSIHAYPFIPENHAAIRKATTEFFGW